MILLRTHANRWTARARHGGTVVGIITLLSDLARPVYRTVRLDSVTGERFLLRDTGALEEAFAVLLAGLERSRIASAHLPPAQDGDGALEEPDVVTDPALTVAA